MKFHFLHQNFNVLNLEKSIKFYDEALGLKVVREKFAEDGSYKIVYLGDGITNFQLELTWLADRKEKYDLGDEEFHLAFEVDNYEEAFKKHKKMNCVVFVNEKMGIYFITDPDGYWLEILPPKKSKNGGCCKFVTTSIFNIDKIYKKCYTYNINEPSREIEGQAH